MCSVNFNSVILFFKGGVCARRIQTVAFDQVVEDFFERYLFALFKEFLVAAFGADLSFLKTGAISKLQYDKSYGDLVKKMGMEKVAEGLCQGD